MLCPPPVGAPTGTSVHSVADSDAETCVAWALLLHVPVVEVTHKAPFVQAVPLHKHILSGQQKT